MKTKDFLKRILRPLRQPPVVGMILVVSAGLSLLFTLVQPTAIRNRLGLGAPEEAREHRNVVPVVEAAGADNTNRFNSPSDHSTDPKAEVSSVWK